MVDPAGEVDRTMSDLEKPLLSTSDEIPSTAVLLERLRAENKQPVVKVAPCIGCGKLPHGSVNDELRCLREALIGTLDRAAFTTAQQCELVTLREKVERLEREAANRSLQARGRG
jgi:hypothetical protein